MKKQDMRLIAAGVILLIAVLVVSFVKADNGLPDNVDIAYPEEGWFCVWTDGVFNGCYSCCDGCEREEIIYPTPEQTDDPDPTKVPTDEPTPDPTPIPTEKVKCNNGGGNGDEGCDPQDTNPAEAPTNPSNDPD